MNPKLLHSVSYAGFWGQARLTLSGFIDKAAGLGYDGVMLMAKRPHLSVLDYDTAAARNVRRQLDERGLRHVCIAGYNNFTADLEHGDIPNQEIQIQHVTNLARLAHEIGAQSVRIFTGYENPARDYGVQWRMLVDCLGECARRAAPLGVAIGVQNHHDLAAGYESMYDLIHAVNEPNCRAMFDAWAPHLHGVDVVAAARKLAPVAIHTTIADYQIRPRYRYNPAAVNYTPTTALAQAVPMGQGVIDYRGFLEALRESGFAGSIAYEMCSPLVDGGSLATLDRYATGFLEFMRSTECVTG